MQKGAKQVGFQMPANKTSASVAKKINKSKHFENLFCLDANDDVQNILKIKSKDENVHLLDHLHTILPPF